MTTGVVACRRYEARGIPLVVLLRGDRIVGAQPAPGLRRHPDAALAGP